MKIVYVANMRLPTEKAHGAQIMKTCEALAELGHDVELIVPDKKTDLRDELFSYYGIHTHFEVRRLPLLRVGGYDTVGYGRLGFLIESFLFAHAVRRYLKGLEFDVLYSRDELILARLSAPYVWESHTGAWNAAAEKVARRAKSIVVITQGLKNFYGARGISKDKIVVAHDGVDLEQFAHPQSKQESRTRLGVPLDAKIAMYIGRLDGWKGVETLLEASTLLTNVMVVVIGGEPAQVSALSKRYPGVRFLGFRPYRELADNMAAADVLVLPNTGKDPISTHFTSPLKLFAYMTTGIPIVASDLPSIREVVDEQSAFLVTPDDPNALALGIAQALEDGKNQAIKAPNLVKEYSWKHRAERIVVACQ